MSDELQIVLAEMDAREATAELNRLREVNGELLEACTRLLRFNEDLCRDINVSTHYPSADFARKAIAKAQPPRLRDEGSVAEDAAWQPMER